jgi:hypothetical protein
MRAMTKEEQFAAMNHYLVQMRKWEGKPVSELAAAAKAAAEVDGLSLDVRFLLMAMAAQLNNVDAGCKF